MSEAELLAAADLCAETARQAEVGLLRIAYQWAVVHAPERLDPVESAKPGREKVRQLGGPGTPQVCEFAAAELGLRIGRTTYAAAQLMADALDLRHRHPDLWRRVEAGEVRASYARHVCAKTRALTEKQAAFVDRAVAQSADGRIPWSRFEVLVEASVKAADPVAAAQAEEAEHRRQFANPTHSDEHGMRGFYIRGPFATIAKLDAAVAFFATVLLHLGDVSTDDERRVKAVLILANPVTAVELLRSYREWLTADAAPAPTVDFATLLPAVTIYVHLYGGAETTGIARVEGTRPVTQAWIRDHLGPHARFTIRPVLDIEGQAPVDAYEIPDRHRRAVHLMTPADSFPHSTNTNRSQQIDHTIAFKRGAAAAGTGQSRVGNYGKLTVIHHRIKTFGGWQVQQPFPGIYLWRDPFGALYLVDHTGTRRIGIAA
jgi:hypothetical protein